MWPLGLAPGGGATAVIAASQVILGVPTPTAAPGSRRAAASRSDYSYIPNGLTGQRPFIGPKQQP